MTKLELFVSKQIRTLLPNFDVAELNAVVSLSSYSIEFFATVAGKRRQCFEMIDEGMFTEKDFDIASKAIANYFRKLPDFNVDGINKYSVTLKM